MKIYRVIYYCMVFLFKQLKKLQNILKSFKREKEKVKWRRALCFILPSSSFLDRGKKKEKEKNDPTNSLKLTRYPVQPIMTRHVSFRPFPPEPSLSSNRLN